MQGSVRSVACFMLDKVPAPALIPCAVESSVRPYALQNQLGLDELLLHYIKVDAHTHTHMKCCCQNRDAS